MNRDDIIRMAREAGIVVTGEAVWRLCELVAAAEREACAQVADYGMLVPPDGGSPTEDECKVAEGIAAAIRARGEK